MLSIVKSMSLHGLEGYLVEVQVDVSGGLPAYDIVGLPDISVKESKERVKVAIKNSGIDLKSRKVLINLAPADTKKEGTLYDLPIAVATLIANEIIKTEGLENTIFPMCLEASKLGMKRAIIPLENANEAAIVEKIDVIGVKNLREVIDILNGESNPNPTKININDYFLNNFQYNFDFSDVKGQENIKRALEVTAAGGHNCLLVR